jgi:hypothetical protein
LPILTVVGNIQSIKGGETHLYTFKDDPPVFVQILNQSDFLVFNNRQFFHYTSPIKVTTSKTGTWDVFVFTCPGLIATSK